MGRLNRRHPAGPHNLSLQLVGFAVGHFAALSPQMLSMAKHKLSRSLPLSHSPSRCVCYCIGPAADTLAANINSGKIYNALHMFLANEANGWQGGAGSARICVQASWPSYIRLCLHIWHCVCTRMCLPARLPVCSHACLPACLPASRLCVRVCFQKAPLVTCSIKPEMTPEPTKVTLCTVLHLASS